jgi:serine/threonine protein phosphatase PrpC
MNPAVLRGREHTVIGAVATIAEGRCAVAISRGGAGKTYAHTDPNEDVAAFRAGEGGVLLAVADGHWGCDAAELAVERLVERHARHWTGASATGLAALWSSQARGALVDVNETIVREAVRRGAAAARTTLALALLRPGDDLFAWASMGDSHVFCIVPGGAEDHALAPDTPRGFLGSAQETAVGLREKCVLGTAPLGGIRAVALVTDGLSETGIGVADPAAAVAAAVRDAAGASGDLRPLAAARAIVERALAAQRDNRAGDNVAAAVAWLAP